MVSAPPMAVAAAFAVMSIIFLSISCSDLMIQSSSNAVCNGTGKFMQYSGIPITSNAKFVSGGVFTEFDCVEFIAYAYSKVSTYQDLLQTNVKNKTLYFYKAFEYNGFVRGYVNSSYTSSAMLTLIIFGSIFGAIAVGIVIAVLVAECNWSNVWRKCVNCCSSCRQKSSSVSIVIAAPANATHGQANDYSLPSCSQDWASPAGDDPVLKQVPPFVENSRDENV